MPRRAFPLRLPKHRSRLRPPHHDHAFRRAPCRGRTRAHAFPRLHDWKSGMTTLAPASLLFADGFLSPLSIEDAVRRALDEDFVRDGEITSIDTIPEDTPARAIMVARQPGVIAG